MRIHPVWKDLRLSLRLLSRNRGFAVVSLLTLAIGIGASTAIFSFVDAVLLKPLPYETADRIIRALETRPNGETAWISTPDFLDWREQNAACFALVALVLASVGIFGLLHHSMLHRRHEIGIRAALGASPRHVVGRGLSLTAGGIALGLVAAYGLAPLLAPLLYRTDPHEPPLMVAVSIVLLLVALCASAGPAIRAARVAPHVVLRGD